MSGTEFAETAVLVAAMEEDSEAVAEKLKDFNDYELGYLESALDRIYNALNEERHRRKA